MTSTQIGLVILMQFVMAFGAWESNAAAESLRAQVVPVDRHNTEALGQTVRHAALAGATEQHISETIGMMSVFAGLPAVTRASELAKKVMADKKDDET